MSVNRCASSAARRIPACHTPALQRRRDRVVRAKKSKQQETTQQPKNPCRNITAPFPEPVPGYSLITRGTEEVGRHNAV